MEELDGVWENKGMVPGVENGATSRPTGNDSEHHMTRFLLWNLHSVTYTYLSMYSIFESIYISIKIWIKYYAPSILWQIKDCNILCINLYIHIFSPDDPDIQNRVPSREVTVSNSSHVHTRWSIKVQANREGVIHAAY